MASTILWEFSWIATVTCTLLLFYVYFIKPYFDRLAVPVGKKRVPQVEGCLPIIGHGFKYFGNEFNFMKACYEKYGGVFQIKIWFTSIIVICDQNLVMPYLKEKESILAFFRTINPLNFDWILFEPGMMYFKGAIDILQKGVGYKQNCLLSKMEEEMGKIAQRLKSFCNNRTYKCILNTEMDWYVTQTNFACFAPIQLNEIVSEDLKRLYRFSNRVVKASVLVPRWILKPAAEWRMRQLRRKLSLHFIQEIQTYRDDPNKSDTNLIRIIIDNGGHLTNEQVAELIAGFIYLSSTNTSVALTNVMTNLALPENAARLENIREECQKSVGDVSKIIRAPLLNGFIMETVRLSSQAMAQQRTVVNPQFCLGDYFIGNKINHLALSPIILQVYGNSSNKLSTEFIPERFTGSEPESQTCPNIIAWSGGLHVCPGRTFSINQIKIIISHLLLCCDFKIIQNLGNFEYKPVVAFGKRTTKVEISERKIKTKIENPTAEKIN